MAALLTLSVACTAQSKEQQETAKAEILHINANYMREHIYDFEAHPDTFVYKGDKPAIIDFYADWCRPCRQLAPKLQKVADRYADQLVVYKVNVDENPQLAALFGVQSIPMGCLIPVFPWCASCAVRTPLHNLRLRRGKCIAVARDTKDFVNFQSLAQHFRPSSV